MTTSHSDRCHCAECGKPYVPTCHNDPLCGECDQVVREEPPDPIYEHGLVMTYGVGHD